jgi:two-component system, cell cycle sensor histidine kinase and response regulator CckA
VPERRRYHTLFETMPIGVVFQSPTGEIIDANPAALRILGVTRDQMLGRTSFDPRWRTIHEDGSDFPAETHPSMVALKSGQEVPFTNMGVFHPLTNDWVWIRVRAVPLRGDNDALVEVYTTFEDITEPKRLREQLHQAQKMEAVGTLAGGVAHDFNNILTVIGGHAEFLAERLAGDPPGMADLSEITKAVRSAAGLTKQLLAFGRKQMLAPVVMDLREQVAETVPMIRRLVGEDVTVSLQVAAAPVIVKADATQMNQVLLNLAANARDAMPHGGSLRVSVDVVTLDAEYAHAVDLLPGEYALATVSDTGHGMTEQVRKRVFEPFFTTKPPGRGTGLGLSTVFGILKQSGGHVGVYSEVGIGTTFRLYLPLSSAAAGPQREPQDVLAQARGSETVLLVEDEPSVRAVARSSLVRHGYTVLEAANAQEALLLAERFTGTIHLLLTDVVMPDSSGPAVAQQMMRLRSDIRVQYMSGYAGDALDHRGLLEIGSRLLQKPFSVNELVTAVRRALDA